MGDDSRLTRAATIVRPSEAERTLVRTGGPPAGEANADGRIELHTTVIPESAIAEGGMAVVFRARDRTLGRAVAMKVLRNDVSEIAREGFEREARLMARLDHPGIVGVYAMASPTDDAQLFTMKLVEGHTIAEVIDSGRPPRGRALVSLLRSVLRMCETLSYAHDRGVLHRDLKPENVMLGRYGECYIMDWGVAIDRHQPKPSDSSTEVVGTPAFMPPEQAKGRNAELDERTDVFGVGAIIYYILTGEPPFDGPSLTQVLEAACRGEVRPPELVIPELPIPARLSDIVHKALAADPDQRFSSVRELHDALEQFLFTGEWFTRRRFEPGALLFKEGELGERAYIVEHGRCLVFRLLEGREHHVAEIGTGEIVGELALVSQGKRTASVRALTPMTVLEVSRDALERELPAGSWTRQIIDTLVGRFLSMEGR